MTRVRSKTINGYAHHGAGVESIGEKLEAPMARVFVSAITGGGPPEYSRRLLPSQRVLEAVLLDAIEDLKRDDRCPRRANALAWVVGHFECGCPFETTLSFEEVAVGLRQDPEWLRARLLERYASHRGPGRPFRCPAEDVA